MPLTIFTGMIRKASKKPSFLHGWSSVTNELCYCAFREIDGGRHVDVYKIMIPENDCEPSGEVRLTDAGFNDGPEFSPDGRHIWYNSTVTGLMQIWRMNADGRLMSIPGVPTVAISPLSATRKYE